uniref:protein PLANT CADMIUM RESISTANCE 2-like n=1 Tax=Fragaria vesca subsp. vesca TaxID=101020 RepID=UPI0005CA1002|nr:PREDICTED: protein PLANT CADMIUM RESISTANCE 2-like [Fragaria vesca subsp. vesca]
MIENCHFWKECVPPEASLALVFDNKIQAASNVPPFTYLVNLLLIIISEPWNSGLLDCFSDPKSCWLTFWCPCVTFGRIIEIVDKGSTSLLATGAPYLYRSKLRQQYSLEGSYCGDYMVHGAFCGACALCQEYRELQSRGFNMSIGWHGNMDARNQEVTMGSVPPHGGGRHVSK